jgi:hypothetical protein
VWPEYPVEIGPGQQELAMVEHRRDCIGVNVWEDLRSNYSTYYQFIPTMRQEQVFLPVEFTPSAATTISPR